MKRFLIPAFAVILLAGALPAQIAPPVPPGRPGRPAATRQDPNLAQRQPSSPVEATEEPRFNIEIEANLPAEEAMARVSERLGQPINVIFTGDSAQTTMPALRLHQVTLSEFFAAVQAAGQVEDSLSGRGFLINPVDGAPHVYTFSVRPPEQPKRMSGPLLNTRDPAGPQIAVGPAGTSTSLFFDLSTILDERLTIDDLTTAVRAAWAAAGDPEAPPEALKFHQETKLLIATGPPARLEAVSNIVKLLQERRKPKKEEQALHLERLQREVQALADTREQLTKKMEQAEAVHAQERAELRARIEALQSELAQRPRPN